MGLETYWQKRNFAKTAEPRGRQSRRRGNAFVVQKHDARRLHYDFRLELGGVLLSWAVPKGPSLDPKVKRLAMQTEDHPLDYGDFEGVIPKGEYGGGTVLVWDRGTWTAEGDAEEMYRRGRLNFELHGEKLQGSFSLVRAPSKERGGERRWLLMKRTDAAARPGTDAEVVERLPNSVVTGRDLDSVAGDPDHVWSSKPAHNGKAATDPFADGAALAALAGSKRAALPELVEPQLATLVSEAPEGGEWLHEIKLDGYRILARIEGGRVQLASRRGHDWTARLPSITSALGGLPVKSALLDGEVVVLGENGVSDFQRLQNSMQAGRDAECVYFAFDALFVNGLDLRPVALRERKAVLKAALAATRNARVRYGDHIEGGGAAFFARACELGLEGIISKRADAPYVSGRGRGWLKVKCLSVQEFVIGGYTAPEGSREHLGALLVGLREGDQLVYAGKVGTGFTQASLAELAAKLAPLERDEPPFSNPPRGAKGRGVHWVAPQLVAQIAFVERTREGLIRHSSFQGLRDDKAPGEARLERPLTATASQRTKPERATPAEPKRARPRPGPVEAKTSKTPDRSTARTQVAARRASVKKASPPAPPITLDASRIEITNPDRVLYPDLGLKKRDLLLYYARVARWMLPHVTHRPLMLVRCPEGAGEECFHQKHPSRGMPKAVEQVMVRHKHGPEPNLVVRDVEGLLGLVQMGALEIHAWGCRAEQLDCPDQLVFDLDPDVGLPWQRVVDAAHTLREHLEELGMTGFLKVTGGKGLHVVVPVEPTTPWAQAKQFTKSVADALVRAEPNKYLATMTKQKRKDKLFIDYFRNGAGATSITVFSTRARAQAPVAVPITWEELEAGVSPDQFNVTNIDARFATLEQDPWDGFDDARVAIPGLGRG